MTDRFDERATSWDEDPRRVERARGVAQRIREAVPLDPSVRLVEFGAGTGLLAAELAPHVGSVTLIDASAGMREQAQHKIDAGILGPQAEVSALDLDDADPEVAMCEAIVALMSLHHVKDVTRTLAGFCRMLSSDGTLAIVDLEIDEQRTFHGEDFDGYHGFRRSDLTRWVEAAGFMEIRFAHAYTMEKQGRSYDLFLMTARSGGDG